ncbi:MAG: energy transducer TonB [Pseudomonadota bacterium]
MAQRRKILIISAGIHLLGLAVLPSFRLDNQKVKSKPLALKIMEQNPRPNDTMVMNSQTPTVPPPAEAAESWQDHRAQINQKPKEVVLKAKEASSSTPATPKKSPSEVAQTPPPPKGKESPSDKTTGNKGMIGSLNGISQRNPYEKFLSQAGVQLLNKNLAGTENLEKGDGDRLDLDTKEYRYMGYFSSMRKSIELVWVYPAEAARRGIQGTVTVEFTIEKSGASKKIKVLRSSGSESLDNAIVTAIREAQPFSPLPQGFGKDKLTVTGNFNYVLTGYAISH